ncbi:hypothetical protein DPMN_192021 [Dreissena polymorpha]|uniref:Uncharacterized protein n=1 Tax=Dreissena polymorpha TaxID=45954 RepID=A0A9D4BEY5_DREPO|nr:hypothetical protein DPMN_192021 [Dreissena polymorpha]
MVVKIALYQRRSHAEAHRGTTRMSVQTPVFYGGYINYDLEKLNGTNMYKAQVQVITGWELGTGPCGDNCKVNRCRRELLEAPNLTSPKLALAAMAFTNAN